MSQPISRRQALCGIAVGLAAPAVLAACGSGRLGGPVSAKPGTVLAKVSDVPVGSGLLANAGDKGAVLLTAPQAGRIHAFSPICPHAGTTLPPPQNGIITCPAHGSQFDPSTGALERGPAQRGLTPVAIRITNGNVVLA